jgi:hypothetical protein
MKCLTDNLKPSRSNRDNCRISGFHGAEHEDVCHVGCCAVYCDTSLPTFQKCSLHHQGDRDSLKTETSVNFYQTTRPHGPENRRLYYGQKTEPIRSRYVMSGQTYEYRRGNLAHLLQVPTDRRQLEHYFSRKPGYKWNANESDRSHHKAPRDA